MGQALLRNFDQILSSAQGPEFLAQVTRLYLIVQGRPPDPDGLRAFVGHLEQGMALRDLVAIFLASDEFKLQVGAGCSEQVLLRNAGGEEQVDANRRKAYASDCDLALALVLSPEVASRLPVLPALYPDGVLLEHASDYRIWLAGRPNLEAALDKVPTVSFIMTETRPVAGNVETTIRTVLELNWPGLEVVICAWRFGPELGHVARTDKRVRLLRTPFWYDANQRFNYGLARCRSEFAALIVAGERVDLRAAPAVVARLRHADIVLSDEDAIDPAGLRHSPRFGQAWDPDRVIATGQPGLLLARRMLLHRAGGLHSSSTPSTLLLRAAALTAADRIIHVPAVLLSRPMPLLVPGAAQIKEVEAYLAANGQPGCTVQVHSGLLRVIHPMPRTPPRVSVVIATRNQAQLLGRCMEGLLARTDYEAMEVVIVDNGSDEPEALSLLRRLAMDTRVRVLFRPGAFNWSALNNAGVAAMSGSIAVLLNNDTEVMDPLWLREMVSQVVRPGVGAVGAKLLYPDSRVQHAGIVLASNGHALHMWRGRSHDDPGYLNTLVVTRQVSAVTGACLAIRREVYDAVGGCNAANLPITWNDIDLCLQVQAHGLRVIWTPYVRLLHLEQASRGSDNTPDNDVRFRREQAWMRVRWGDTLVADPFLNANVLYSEETLRLATQLE